MESRSQRRRLLTWWEERPIPVQLGVAAAVLVPVWTVINLMLNQPLFWRAIIYGVFWGGLSVGAVFGATRSERSRRIEADRDGPPHG